MPFHTQPIPNEQAARIIADKPALLRKAFDLLPAEIRARTFTIGAIDQLDLIAGVRDIVSTIPQGADWKDAVSDITATLLPHFVDPNADEEEQAAQAAAARRRADIIVRTHGQQAYSTASYQTHIETIALFPYWLYRSMGDNRVREAHQALNNLVLPATHEFWLAHYPPWDWGCRCIIIPLSDFDYAEIIEADKSRPESERWIPTGDRLTQLEREGILTWKDSPVDVRSPVQKAIARGDDTSSAYNWHPSFPILTLEQLTDRYAGQPDVIQSFLTFAENIEVAPGTTLLQHLFPES